MDQDLLNWLPVLVNVIVVIIGLAVALRKVKPEIESIKAGTGADNASAVESYANATKIYSEELGRVNEQITILIGKIEEKDRIIVERDKMIASQTITIEKVSNWAERLLYQVKSLGGVPVPFDVESIVKGAEVPPVDK